MLKKTLMTWFAEEAVPMLKGAKRKLCVALAAGLLLTNLVPALTLTAEAAEAAKEASPVGGIKVSGSFTDNNGTISFSATGSQSSSGCSTTYNSETTTITIKNTSGVPATIGFDVTFMPGAGANGSTGSYTINGAAGASPYSKLMEPDETLKIIVTSPEGNYTATLTLSNFSCVAAAAESDVTFHFDSTMGSVTVDGAAIADGDVKEISSTEESTLVATPKSGVVFLGWVNGDNVIQSTDTTYQVKAGAKMTLRAAFASAQSNAYFKVGGNLYDNLTDAAAGRTSGTIVVASDGILPSGNYTIPAGVTLLVPFDAAKTLCTTEPKVITEYTQPTAYRTLTMANGAHIDVEGSVSISGSHCAGGSTGNGGSPTQPVGFVRMKKGSSITVKQNGALYAWGYITDAGEKEDGKTVRGTVLIESGATVYEDFQVRDFRGGNATSKMGSGGVFPFSQYYMQNIEVPMTVNAGAVETGYYSCSTSAGVTSTPIPFIGGVNSSSMFRMKSGSITKEYDGSTDRLIVTTNSELYIEPMNMKFYINISSSKYELPITNNMTVNVNSGSVTVEQDCAFLPGCAISVAADATFQVKSGKSIYLYDKDQWTWTDGTTVKGYVGSGNAQFVSLPYAPGKAKNRSVDDLKDAKFTVAGALIGVDGYIYTTSSGAEIAGVDGGQVILKPGEKTSTQQAIQEGNTIASKPNIPITAAKLKNADGTYTESAKYKGQHTYNYSDGKWTPVHAYETTVTDPTCTEQGYTTHACSKCGDSYKDDYKEATGHSWNAPTYVWTDDLTGCTAARVCANDAAHVETENAAMSETETKAPTCTEVGKKTVMATFTSDAFETQTKTGVDVPMVPHTPVKTEAKVPTCTETGNNAYWTCSVCGRVFRDEACTSQTTVADETLAIVSAAHDWNEPTYSWSDDLKQCTATRTCKHDGSHKETETVDTAEQVTLKETCTTAGTKDITATFENAAFAAQTKTGVEIPAPGHAPEKTEAKAATCVAAGNNDYWTCATCGDVFKDAACTQPTTVTEETIAIDETAHDWNDPTYTWTADGASCTAARTCKRDRSHTETETVSGAELSVTRAATCKTPGVREVKATFTNPAFAAQTKIDAVIAIDPANHEGDTELRGVATATCKTQGYSGGTYCKACNAKLADGSATALDPSNHEATLTHTGANAPTCTAGGNVEYWSCAACGKNFSDAAGKTALADTVDPTAGHAYETTVTAPTCTEDGYTTHTCSKCGDSYKDDYKEATGHNRDDGEVTKEPTCTETGVKTFTCTVCGDKSKTEPIDKLPHTYSIAKHDDTDHWSECACGAATAKVAHSGGAATCTEKAVCGGCHASYGSLIPHTPVKTEAKAPTCVAGGNNAYWTCTACGGAFRDEACTQPTTVAAETLGVDSNAHDWNEPAYSWSEDLKQCAATRTCARCDEHVETETATSSNQVTKPAACAAAGELTWTVTFQNAGFAAQTTTSVIPATGHTSDGGKITTPATCDDSGVKTYTCTVCTAVLKTEEIPAKGHTSDGGKVTKAATCTTPGVKTYTCTACTAVMNTEEIPATGHTSDGGKITKAATCIATGIRTYTCTVCTAVLDTEEIPTVSHVKDEGTVVKEPSCSEAGLKHYECVNCQADLGNETIPTLPHTRGEGAVTKTPGCTEKGAKVYRCTECDAILETEILAPTGHTEDGGTVTAPSCEEAGATVYRCVKCDAVVRSELISATGHTWDEGTVTDPSCEEAGETVYKCVVCHVVLSAEEISAKGHTSDGGKITKAATCIATGIRTYTCTECGHVIGTEVIPLADHVEDAGTVTTEPTCSATGVKSYQCSICDANLRTETIDKLTHTEDAGTVTTEPTCSATGVKSYKCSVCGVETRTETIGKLAHTEDAGTVTTEPTCSATGVKSYKCSVCGVETRTETVDKLAHTEDAGTVTTEPTTSSTGVRTFTCVNCGAVTRTETIDMLPSTPSTPSVPDPPSVPEDPPAPPAPEAPEELDEPETPDEPEVPAEEDLGEETEVPLSAIQLPFIDVANTDWSHDAIAFVYYNDLMIGMGDQGKGEIFAPKMDLSRAGIVTLLYNLEKRPEAKGTNHFADVADNAWYANAITWGAETGLVEGNDDGTFGGVRACTREQMFTLFYRYAVKKGLVDGSVKGDLSRYTDRDRISGYALEAMEWAVGAGLVQGYDNGALGPKDIITREQMAMFMLNFSKAFLNGENSVKLF